jgi:hypothetical protein
MSFRNFCSYASILSALEPASALAQSGCNVAHIDIRHNMPFVQVMVDDEGSFAFGIDTWIGAKHLCLPTWQNKSV